MTYTHQHIEVNGRRVALSSITEGSTAPKTKYEAATFDFIRSWLLGTETFTLQTSGSTGEPKIIHVTREQMIASARMTIEALSLRSGMCALICIDTNYVGGRMMLVRSLVADMQMVIVDPTADPFAKLKSEGAYDFAAMVPLQIHSVLGSKRPQNLSRISTIIIGGAALSADIILRLQEFSCRCYATYAMTETISHVALKRLNGDQQQESFEGLPGIQFSLDSRSCLVIKAPFLPAAIVTNDIVELASPTTFSWIGRYDNVMNSGGVKVIPEKIEQQLLPVIQQYKFVKGFFVSSLPDERLGQQVVLVIESDNIPPKKLLEKLSAELFIALPRYEVPKQILFSTTFSLTPTGKYNRVKSLTSIHFAFMVSR